MPPPQTPVQMFALATAPQLMRQLKAGGQSLAQLQRMLRTAWLIPNGKGEEAAEAIWEAIIRNVESGSASSPTSSSQQPHSEFTLDDAQRLALLRTTFTEEAERLARWGMTPVLPGELRQLVAQAWAERVSEAPDRMGRSRDTLQQDLGNLTQSSRGKEPGHRS